MGNDDKLPVTLNIAGEQLKTVINRADEESIRRIEKEVTGLFDRWRIASPMRSKQQVLAMVAFQYAKLYHDQVDASQGREASLRNFIEQFEKRLDEIVLDV